MKFQNSQVQTIGYRPGFSIATPASLPHPARQAAGKAWRKSWMERAGGFVLVGALVGWFVAYGFIGVACLQLLN